MVWIFVKRRKMESRQDLNAYTEKKISVAFRIIYSADAEKHTKHIGKTARKGYNVKDDTPDKI